MSKRRKTDHNKEPLFDYIDPTSISRVSHACIIGSVALLKELLDAGHSPNVKDNQGRLPLHIAAERGDTASCKLILEGSTAVDVNAMTHTNKSALLYAVQSDSISTVELFLSHNADPSLGHGDGTNCLEVAVENHNVSMFCILLRSVDPNISSFDGWNVAHTCAKQGAVECLQHLLNDERFKVAMTYYGVSPLHIACQEGQLECVELLVKCGMAIDAPADDNVTPVFLAAQNNYPDIVEFLLRSNASVSIVTEEGTVVHSGVVKNSAECLRLLLLRGADVEGCVEQTSVETPLCQAVYKEHVESVEVLLEYGASPLNKGQAGLETLFAEGDWSDTKSTPLHVCIEQLSNPHNNVHSDGESKRLEILQLLFENIREKNYPSYMSHINTECTFLIRQCDKSYVLKLFLHMFWDRFTINDILFSILLEIVPSHRCRMLALTISCNFNMSSLLITDSLIKYFNNSTAGKQELHAINRSLFDQLELVPKDFYSILTRSHNPITTNLQKQALMELIERYSTQPRTLAELCRFKIRQAIGFSLKYKDIVEGFHITRDCKDILLMERGCTVSVDQLRSSAPEFPL